MIRIVMSDKEAHKDEIKVDAPNFWYFHGKLEYYFNYDKAEMYVDEKTCKEKGFRCQSPNDELLCLKEGIYTVHVENYKRKCRAYLWTRAYANVTALCGLIVDAYSIKDNLYAYRKYKNRASFI